MNSPTQTDAARALEAHGNTIDVLHEKLAAQPGCDTAQLQKAVDTYKAAHQKFTDDALGCMN